MKGSAGTGPSSHERPGSLILSLQTAGSSRGTVSPPTIKNRITEGVEPAPHSTGRLGASLTPKTQLAWQGLEHSPPPASGPHVPTWHPRQPPPSTPASVALTSVALEEDAHLQCWSAESSGHGLPGHRTAGLSLILPGFMLHPCPQAPCSYPAPPQSWECSKLPLHTWCAYISTQEAAGPHFTPLHLHSGGCYPHLPYPWPPRTPLTFPNSGYMTTPFMMLFLAPGPLQSPDSNSPSVMLSRMPPLGQSPVCCCPSHQAEHLAGREPELPVVSVSSQAPITRRPPVLSLGWKEIGERLPTPPCPSPTQRVHVPCLPVCLGKGGKNRACPILLYHTGVAAAKPATRFPYPCPQRLPLLKRLVHSLPGIRASQ